MNEDNVEQPDVSLEDRVIAIENMLVVLLADYFKSNPEAPAATNKEPFKFTAFDEDFRDRVLDSVLDSFPQLPKEEIEAKLSSDLARIDFSMNELVARAQDFLRDTEKGGDQ